MATIDFLRRFPQSILNRNPDSNLGKLWSMFSAQLDEIETQLVLMKNLLSIYDNVGINLDQIGTFVNELRDPGKVDNSYRLDLFIAVAKRISGGTIPELVEIGSNIAGKNIQNRFRVDELWDLTGTIFLDATEALDGTEPLDPSAKRSASVESLIEGNVDDITVPLEVGDAIDQIKPAGVFAKFRIIFRILTSQSLLYAVPTLLLNATGLFDGKTLMSTRFDLAIDEIAIGDGATREPLPSDTGLQNEIVRKTAIKTILENGEFTWTIEFSESEINSFIINELAGFEQAGDIVCKDRFEGKAKNSSLLYKYEIIQNLN